MRPTLILGLAALAAATTLGTPAGADGTAAPPTVTVANGTVTANATAGTHLNAQFSWSLKDSTGNKIKGKTDFPWPSDGSNPGTIAIGGAVAGAVLRGGYCKDTGCYTFSATCAGTSGACTAVTP